MYNLNKILQSDLEFINISNEDFTLFEYKPPRSFKNFALDLNIVKQNTKSNIFFHLFRGNLKIVNIRLDDLIYTAGSTNKIQYQLLEALIEQTAKNFNITYDVKYILSYGNFDNSIFRDYKDEIVKLIQTFDELKAVKVINVPCSVCDKVLPLIVKKSFIENAESYPAPLVYMHEGHSILCFIDKNYDVRGVELVNITG
ncbi:MAG: hypothetical protein EAX89_09670 [Candidatus Lokiarchaeota archaeon]|nr:hypothetical protein [Candidatus Lokiarchaeota archaeon]